MFCILSEAYGKVGLPKKGVKMSKRQDELNLCAAISSIVDTEIELEVVTESAVNALELAIEFIQEHYLEEKDLLRDMGATWSVARDVLDEYSEDE